MTKIESPSLDTLTNYCVYVLKFRVCEHGMSCTLEIKSTGKFKRGHVESCFSTTKSIMPPLELHSPWSLNLAEW